MELRKFRFLGALLAWAAIGSPSFAADTVVADQACNIDGLSRPYRQTVVLIDELAIDSWAGGDLTESNRRLINDIVSLAGVEEGQPNTNSAPRERMTILFAKADGSDLLRVFSGCPPTYSPNELDGIAKSMGGVQRVFQEWLGKDPRSRVDSSQKEFRIKLLTALVQIAKATPKHSSSDTSKFLRLLAQVDRNFDLANGVPRLVIFSPLHLAGSSSSEGDLTRASGFQDAKRFGADLKRAEAYVVKGKTSSSSPEANEYLSALLLGSKAHVVAVSGETLPALLEPPEKVQVYGGFISYGPINAPMQVRLAIDSSGSLVDSWVEVTVDRATATPLTGKAICKTDRLDDCDIRGDGKEFAQAWAPAPNADKPTFDEKLPFSGLRWFEFTTANGQLSGRFYDPMVIINKEKEIPFKLALTPNVKF